MKFMNLRHLAEIQNSNVDKVISAEETPIRLCNYVDVYRNDFIAADMEFSAGSATPAEIARFRLKVGDVIITKDSEDRHDIGVPAYVQHASEDLICGYHLTMLRAYKRRAEGRFLFWALQSKAARESFAIAANGVTRFGLTQEGIKSLRLWVTDLPTQKSIADFLDRETGRIDELIVKKERLVELLNARLQSEITQAVTQGLDSGVAKVTSNVDWIGDIPKHWQMVKLGYLGRCSNGINIGGAAFGSGYPFISYGDVYKNRVLPSRASGLVQSSKTDRKSYDVQEGDIFFTRTSETIEEIGLSSVCRETLRDAVFAGFLIRFRPAKDKLNPLFSTYAFQNLGLRHYFAKEMNLITRASLSQDLLRNMPVALPPADEQFNIGRHLERMEATILQLTLKTKASISRLKEYRAALITSAVTGQVDMDTYDRTGKTSATLDWIEEEMQA